MHMADALISPVVGGTMLAAAVGVAAYSIKKIRYDLDEKKIPLMGVMGAFVFVSQMINFTIPGTGSSGHLGGGLLLAILLGSHAGFLTMASVLLIQALFFGDGGLLAYGCNLFNLGFYTCFIAYPLIYKCFTRKTTNSKKIFAASMVSAIVGLQIGSFSVVLETLLSGKTELHFGAFLLMMQPIHLAIGVVEGFATATVVTFVWKARPEIIENAAIGKSHGNISTKKLLIGLAAAVIIVGGALSWFASANPDGLEWSIEKTVGTEELESSDKIHKIISEIQEKTAFLPDYGFKTDEKSEETSEKTIGSNEEAWPAMNAGTSVSGIVGGILTLALIASTGIIIIFIKRRKNRASA
ncbi:energy-coupling factor ABC transporter permease [Acetivibrio cellulolyticus]|uniref:energy-coupling factor ABC transporter permease n=1 Tax=Acetivibrio cellulolyticus TaxID=35830 RepID=UPI0001E2F147|nr:energy-coupling factor ABC transporter permease [Acetivibrio cellulolyticus]